MKHLSNADITTDHGNVERPVSTILTMAGDSSQNDAEEIVKQALSRFVHDSISPVAIGLSFLYLLFAISHSILLPRSIGLIMALSAIGSIVLLLSIVSYHRRGAISTAHSHAWATLIGSVVFFNSWLHLWLTRDPLQSTNLLLLVVGVGFFFLSSRWLIGFLLAMFLSCAGTFYLLGVSQAESTHFAFAFLSAALLATLAHLARKRTLSRLSLLHVRDEKRASDLQAMLEIEQEREATLRKSEANYRQLSIQLEEQAEALQIANQGLANASKLKDEFLASMSHELRTPLTAVLGLTESLGEHVYGPLTERQHGALKRVQESGRHLLTLINDILDVAKIEAGKLDLDLSPADLQMVSEASIRFVEQEATQKELTIDIVYDPQVTLILADERRLKQMLMNLLSNAVKFTPEGGQIGLRLTGDAEDEIVRFTIWDTGIGITPEQMARLFKPFIQLDSRLARRYNGSGLGLVLVYRMVELHGGSIALTSQPGAGSEFTIALPWRRVRHPLERQFLMDGVSPVEQATQQSMEDIPRTDTLPTTSNPLANTHPQTPSILIVDDHPLSRAWMATLVKKNGYIGLEAADSTEALQLAVEQKPNLILIDLQMTSGDGLTLIHTVARDSRLQNIPLVAMSALGLDDTAERSKTVGAVDYFIKPLGQKTLHRLLERWFPESMNAPTALT